MANLLTALLRPLARAPWSYHAVYEREVCARRVRGCAGPVVTEADLSRLPGPVARYLRRSGALGRPRPTSFRARFRGEIRSREGAPWMPFVAEQCSFLEPPARLFFMQASRGGIPFDVLHRYREGVATMQVRVASLVRVVDGRGPVLDRSETVTFLNDACLLAPGALVGPAFRWEGIDDLHARVRFACGANEVAAELTFEADGRLLDFVSDDRTRSDDGVTGERLRWSTPVRAERERDGGRGFGEGDAVWHAKEGPYVYGRFELVELAYDVTPADQAARAVTRSPPSAFAA